MLVKMAGCDYSRQYRGNDISLRVVV